MAYLQNAWYVAAFADEITDKPLGRVLLDQPVVFYRTRAGAPVALLNRCPHRFVPLSRGRVVDDQIECGYHGLRFDGTGACTLNPHGSGLIPDRASVRQFPVVERHGLLWFWPGDPQKADSASIPDEFAFLTSPKVRTVRGYLTVDANYQLVADNLLDLSHTTYAHPQMAVTTVKPSSPVAQTKLKAELLRDGNTVWAKRSREAHPPSDKDRNRYGVSAELVNSRGHMHWSPPALLYFDLGVTECTPEAKDFALPGAHFITPQTELTCHYFFFQGRNVRLESAEVDKMTLDAVLFAFGQQDKPLLEAQQRMLGPTADLMAGRPILLETDGAPIAARRLLDHLIRQEQAQAGLANATPEAGAA